MNVFQDKFNLILSVLDRGWIINLSKSWELQGRFQIVEWFNIQLTQYLYSDYDYIPSKDKMGSLFQPIHDELEDGRFISYLYFIFVFICPKCDRREQSLP